MGISSLHVLDYLSDISDIRSLGRMLRSGQLLQVIEQHTVASADFKQFARPVMIERIAPVYTKTDPPATSKIIPVVHAALSKARNSHAPCLRGVVRRFMGCRSRSVSHQRPGLKTISQTANTRIIN